MTITELKKELIGLSQGEKLSLIWWLMDNLTYTGTTEQQSSQSKSSDFFASAGLWANRDIDQSSLRRDAWPQRSS